MKRVLLLTLVLALLAGGATMIDLPHALTEEEFEMLPYPGEPVELTDGEGNPVATLRVCGYYSREGRDISVVYALTNTSDLALTRVTFTVDYRNAERNSLWEKPLEVVHGMAAEPLAIDETREFTRRHWFDGAETAVDFDIVPVLAETELDLMPWTEPQPGNLLLDFCNYPPFSAYFENLDDNPPVKMICRVDQREDEEITDPEVMLAEIERLKNMRIGGESEVRVTDSAISYWFTMADGTQWDVSFEAPGLFNWHGKVYEVLRD